MSNNKFIIVFQDGVTKDQIKEYADQVNKNGGEVTQIYESVVNGFAAKVTPEQLQNFQSLQGENVIKYIEEDAEVTTQ